MDTKWKKWKVIISFIVFFTGITMLLWNIIFVAQRMTWSGDSWKKDMKAALSGDYQNTEQFQWYISKSLESFFSMATGGQPNNYIVNYYKERGYDYGYDYGYYYDYWDEDDFYSDYGDQLDKVDHLQEEMDEYQDQIEELREMWADEETEELKEELSDQIEYMKDQLFNMQNEFENAKKNMITPEEYKKKNEEAIKKLQEARQKDKNLLYIVSSEGKTLYSNADGTGLDGPGSKLPKGYNFLLYFDGSKVKIIKDGAELDVYGDGIYRESSEWSVPGYQNYEVGEELKNVTVCMAAAKNPVEYLVYKKNEFRGSNGLYQISVDARARGREMQSIIPCLAAGLLFLVIAVFLRRQIRYAGNGIGKISGRIWFEGKLILFLLFFLLVFQSDSYILEWWKNGEIWYSGLFYEYIRNILLKPAALLGLFWVCCFLFNDLRCNQKPWKHSITAKLYRAAETASLKLPLQKRLLRHHLPVLVIEGILALISAGFILYFLILGHKNTVWLSFLFGCLLLALLILMGIEFKDSIEKKKLAGEIGALIDQIRTVHDGNLSEEMEVPEEKDLAEAVKNLNDIQQGMNTAVQERVKSETMKVELVSNVSHDIKTPLTSIISYVELLKQEEGLPDYIKDYIGILDRKSQRLKEMVQDVFEISKAASGQLPVKIEVLDLGRLLEQTLADMAEKIESSSMIFKVDIVEEPVMIAGDGQRLYRVFQNLLQNALKYSLEGSRIYVTLKVENGQAVASVKNTSKFELSGTVDFTSRFTRGDESRTDGGSGLGLSIAKSFTEACKGTMSVETIADLFVVTVKFQVEK